MASNQKARPGCHTTHSRKMSMTAKQPVADLENPSSKEEQLDEVPKSKLYLVLAMVGGLLLLVSGGYLTLRHFDSKYDSSTAPERFVPYGSGLILDHFIVQRIKSTHYKNVHLSKFLFKSSEAFQNELKMLSCLADSPVYFPKVIAVEDEDKNGTIISGELCGRFSKGEPLVRNHLRLQLITAHLVLMLMRLREKGIVKGGLSPDEVFFDKFHRPVVLDFSSAEISPSDKQARTAARSYSGFSHGVDWWGLARLIAYFDLGYEDSLVSSIGNLDKIYTSYSDPLCVPAFIKRLLCITRQSLDGELKVIKGDRFFGDIDWDRLERDPAYTQQFFKPKRSWLAWLTGKDPERPKAYV